MQISESKLASTKDAMSENREGAGPSGEENEGPIALMAIMGVSGRPTVSESNGSIAAARVVDVSELPVS